MIKRLFTSFILFTILIAFCNIFAQYDPSRGILMYVTKGLDKAPDKPNEIILNLPKMNIILNDFGIEKNQLEPAFPGFKESDTMKILNNGKKIKLANRSKIFRIQIPPSVDRQKVINRLLKLPQVLFAEPDGYVAFDMIPSDALFGDQWNLHNTGQNGGIPNVDIDAPEAWDIYTGSSSQKIGFLDTGIKPHEDLSGRVLGGYVFYNNHGLGVAGIIAANANNWYNEEYFGVAGVDWNAMLINKVISDFHPKGDAEISQKLQDAINEGADIINCSWALLDDSNNPRYSTTVHMAFEDAYKQNVISIASSGNTGDYGNYYQYPAGFGEGIIAVSALDRSGNVPNWSTHHDYVDVAAPGVDILTLGDANGFVTVSGTSFAVPHVTGIVSLLKGYANDIKGITLYSDDIEQIIRLSAEDLNVENYPGWDEYMGTGLVKARKALDLLRAPYELTQESITGGNEINSTDYYSMVFYGVPGLADGMYYVKRYEVRKTVYFNKLYNDPPNVWLRGNGPGTNGYSMANPNFGTGWGEVISVNKSSATFRTYIYKVWTTNWQYCGYKPTTSSNITFNYTVLGIPAPLSVNITGPTYLNSGQTGTFTANPTGGSGTYVDYRWWERNDEGTLLSLSSQLIEPNAPPPGYWIEITSVRGQQTIQRGHPWDFSLKCEVTDSDCNTATDIHSVTVDGPSFAVSRTE